MSVSAPDPSHILLRAAAPALVQEVIFSERMLGKFQTPGLPRGTDEPQRPRVLQPRATPSPTGRPGWRRLRRTLARILCRGASSVPTPPFTREPVTGFTAAAL